MSPVKFNAAETLIEEGRKAVLSLTDRQWRLGDLASEWLNLTTQPLAEYANQIDLEYEPLASYQRVAQAWPAMTRIKEVPWTCYRELARREEAERKLMLAKFLEVCQKEQARPSYRLLQRVLGKTPTPEFTSSNRAEQVKIGLQQMPPKDRLALINETLQQPSTREGMVMNPDLRGGIERTVSQSAREYQREGAEWMRDAREKSAAIDQPQGTNLEKGLFLARMRTRLDSWSRAVDSVVDFVAQPDAVPDARRDALTRSVKQLMGSLNRLMVVLEAPEERSTLSEREAAKMIAEFESIVTEEAPVVVG